VLYLEPHVDSYVSAEVAVLYVLHQTRMREHPLFNSGLNHLTLQTDAHPGIMHN